LLSYTGLVNPAELAVAVGSVVETGVQPPRAKGPATSRAGASKLPSRCVMRTT
jgi:hypothetical protein